MLVRSDLRPPLYLAALILLLSLSLCACGGGGSDSDYPQATQESGPQDAPVTAALPTPATAMHPIVHASLGPMLPPPVVASK